MNQIILEHNIDVVLLCETKVHTFFHKKLTDKKLVLGQPNY